MNISNSTEKRKNDKKMIFYIFSSSDKTPLLRVKCQLFKETLISLVDSIHFSLPCDSKKNVYHARKCKIIY